jgi:hypothetical protein
MKKLTRSEERQRQLMRERLARARVPLPSRPEPRDALPVFIGCEPIESHIFRISPGLNGCVLSITCATDSTSGIYLESAYAELAAEGVHFELLADPLHSGGRPIYRFPRNTHAFERAIVINQEFPGTLYPGRPLGRFFSWNQLSISPTVG